MDSRERHGSAGSSRKKWSMVNEEGKNRILSKILERNLKENII